MNVIPCLGFVLILACGTASPAIASGNKTWVASYGADTGSCPISAPCKTFQYAHNQTTDGGEIDVKDSGGYGTVAITKSISIVAESVLASISVPEGSTGISINVGSTGKVVLRGITVDGHNVGLEGIDMLSAGTLVIDKCTVSNFTDIGVTFRNQGIATMRDSLLTGSRLGSFVYGFNNSVYISNDVVTANGSGINGSFHTAGDNVIAANATCDTCSANLQAIGHQ